MEETESACMMQTPLFTSLTREDDQTPVGDTKTVADWTYEEGRVSNADYDRKWYSSEEEARAACSNDDGCKGYWKRKGDVYFILKSGSGTFSKGVPHHTVLSVKVKKAASAPDVTNEEGRVSNADYDRNWYVPQRRKSSSGMQQR